MWLIIGAIVLGLAISFGFLKYYLMVLGVIGTLWLIAFVIDWWMITSMLWLALLGGALFLLVYLDRKYHYMRMIRRGIPDGRMTLMFSPALDESAFLQTHGGRDQVVSDVLTRVVGKVLLERYAVVSAIVHPYFVAEAKAKFEARQWSWQKKAKGTPATNPVSPSNLDPWHFTLSSNDRRIVPETGHIVTCDDCNGRKYVVCSYCKGTSKMTCPHCHGMGTVHHHLCPQCGGNKKVSCTHCDGGTHICTTCIGSGKLVKTAVIARQDVDRTETIAWGVEGYPEPRNGIEFAEGGELLYEAESTEQKFASAIGDAVSRSDERIRAVWRLAMNDGHADAVHYSHQSVRVKKYDTLVQVKLVERTWFGLGDELCVWGDLGGFNKLSVKEKTPRAKIVKLFLDGVESFRRISEGGILALLIMIAMAASAIILCVMGWSRTDGVLFLIGLGFAWSFWMDAFKAVDDGVDISKIVLRVGGCSAFAITGRILRARGDADPVWWCLGILAILMGLEVLFNLIVLRPKAPGRDDIAKPLPAPAIPR